MLKPHDTSQSFEFLRFFMAVKSNPDLLRNLEKVLCLLEKNPQESLFGSLVAASEKWPAGGHWKAYCAGMVAGVGLAIAADGSAAEGTLGGFLASLRDKRGNVTPIFDALKKRASHDH